MKESPGAEQLQKLRAVPLFAECSQQTLERILEVATEFEAEHGHVLVERGRPGTGLFIIEEGTVSVALPGRTVELGPGEFFGELALLDERAVRTARVSVAARVRGLALYRDDFEDLLAADPKLAVVMLKVLARRLAAAVDPISAGSLDTESARNR
jgi:CRP-like cAMP-binding protein